MIDFGLLVLRQAALNRMTYGSTSWFVLGLYTMPLEDRQQLFGSVIMAACELVETATREETFDGMLLASATILLSRGRSYARCTPMVCFAAKLGDPNNHC